MRRKEIIRFLLAIIEHNHTTTSEVWSHVPLEILDTIRFILVHYISAKIPYSPKFSWVKFSRFDDIQLFRDKVLAFIKNDHMWQAHVPATYDHF